MRIKIRKTDDCSMVMMNGMGVEAGLPRPPLQENNNLTCEIPF